MPHHDPIAPRPDPAAQTDRTQAPHPTSPGRRCPGLAELSYAFDELPLAVVDEAEVAIFAAGAAGIAYDRHGEWEVAALTMDAWRRDTPIAAAERCTIDLPRSNLFFALIERAIHTHLAELIEEKIWAEIGEAREAERNHRDALRSERPDCQLEGQPS